VIADLTLTYTLTRFFAIAQALKELLHKGIQIVIESFSTFFQCFQMPNQIQNVLVDLKAVYKLIYLISVFVQALSPKAGRNQGHVFSYL